MYLINPITFNVAQGSCQERDQIQICDILVRYSGKSNSNILDNHEENTLVMCLAL